MIERKSESMDELLPPESKLSMLLEGRLADPHSILGMHRDDQLDAVIVRCYDPGAATVTLLRGNSRIKMAKIEKSGLFAVKFPGERNLFAYKIEKTFDDGQIFTSEDPYCFLPGVGEMDTYLFNQGEHQRIYEILGAHPRSFGEVKGVVFAVWAPTAERVSVVGGFNCWDGRRHMMRVIGSSGIWELFIPGLLDGDIYKYEIRAANGDIFLKLDPYAYRIEMRPKSAGIICDTTHFSWDDGEWMNQRKSRNWHESPISIYEIHLGTWRHPSLRPIDGSNEDDFHNYRELAHALADYVIEMGYTHVELLPISEHPFDQSWGYQVSGFYAPTARYGTPEDFVYFVNYLHNKGIGVFLDWVPAHFPKDAFSLGRFDGTALYEHADPRQGEHKDWGTYIFNFGRHEVRNFLMGNALFWMEKYHIDGLRVDAVASMLYLNYSRDDGDWIPNKYGSNENLDAISFIKRLNELTHGLHPGTLMFAEESTAWPMVSRPVYLGGLGFDFKWNMGWMHDTLEYFKDDPVFRSYSHGKITFSMLYAFSENFILPFSHDEVVHGKRSLLDKMPGDYTLKFANLRCMLSYMITHPGKKLLFMGCEIAQWTEWRDKGSLDWNILEYPSHSSIKKMVADLNCLYRENSSLWEDDFSPNGFEWIDGSDYQQSIIAYVRWNKNHSIPVVAVMNFTPVPRYDYNLGVPWGGRWKEIFNSDRAEYGGWGNINNYAIDAYDGLCHNKPHHVNIKLPSLGVVILKPEYC